MTLTREHLITSVQNHLNLPKNKSTDLVESTLEIKMSVLSFYRSPASVFNWGNPCN